VFLDQELPVIRRPIERIPGRAIAGDREMRQRAESGSTMSMSYEMPVRAVVNKAISRPALDQIAPPFTDLPSVSRRAAASPVR